MSSTKKERKYMKMAIDEMKESRSEHKNKLDPMVGAVLVDSKGNVLDKTHRGSLRVGDHAEYSLIERLLGNKNVEGSTLFVTLEPCVVRPQKKPCVERIENARIKRVVIGIPDPNPEITGRGIDYLLSKKIEIMFFDSDLADQIREENKYFINQSFQTSESYDKSLTEIERVSLKEKEPVLTATIYDLSDEMIKEYLTIRDEAFDIPSSELWTFFYKNGFLVKQKPGNSYVPTVAGLLLFGKNPEDFLVQSIIKMEANVGNRTSTMDITGPILSMPLKIKDFLNKHLRSYTKIMEFHRVEIPEYPWEALREAIINAIVHRDYCEGAKIMIQLNQDRLVIRSPGYLVKPLSLEKIRKYNAPPFSRNPRIAATFSHVKLMEERGWGFKKMHDILLEHGLRPPKFTYESGYFIVTFFARESPIEGVQIEQELLQKLNKRQKETLEFIYNQQRVTTIECAKKFKINRDTARRDLNLLIELGVIEKRGTRRDAHYIPVKINK